MAPIVLSKDDRYKTITDAIAAVETFAEQTQRRVRVQQPKSSSKETGEQSASTPTGRSNVVVLECTNAPICKWFVRLSFLKGDKQWKISSSLNMEHHKSKCIENQRVDDAINAQTPTQLATQVLTSTNVNTAVAITARSEDEAGASVFTNWKEAMTAIRALAQQTGRRVIAEKATEMMWKGEPVTVHRVVCQNYRNSNCGWMVLLQEETGDSERYTVLSVSLLHSKECLETRHFSARKKPTTVERDTRQLSSSAQESKSDTSQYQLTHEMRWSTGKEVTKAVSDFALVVQHKRSMLCKHNNSGSNKKYVCSDDECLWFIMTVKCSKSKNWKISSMNLNHSETCTGMPKPTARQIAEMRFFRQAVTTHSKSSGTLLTDNFLTHSELGIQIPRGMAYRAQKMVVNASTDDLAESYKFIPSLMESFISKNPGSIATYEKDAQGRFTRAFIMPNSSINVLTNQQQICGIHVLHYGTVSFHGCMALLVTRDGCLEYQVMAFALLPTSELDQMKWFLGLAKRGGARFDGNPVFCSHTEQGLLRALAQEADRAKIMFCVRSLLEEMACDKNIPALGALEEKVWALQRQETEEAFVRTLSDLERLNGAAATFLRAVHPTTWAYYPNRSVRLYGWSTTGAEEALVGSDIQRSDEPPFDLMYTLLAFLMDGIFRRSQAATSLLAVEGRTPSVLTAGADAIYQQELQAAAGYTIRRCDEQVAFAWLTGARPKITYRMDLAMRACTCGQMFQLGLPCRHFIAASTYFADEAALLDSFDPIYKAAVFAEAHRGLRIEIPVAEDLHKDQSLLPAPPRKSKYKKRPRNTKHSAADTSTGVTSASAVTEETQTPLAKTPRLDFDADVVDSFGEIV
ncbi:hypothetical protein P3T76_003344 [Phytophthora citrophthora]|uniref:SWIM-type domain-containing protein n=1 Tax=Phytophthora citrophthora TaxID=4793 RepID=A0AAD9LQL8_9STRA|nr:hypothetical protein P3T76_003344 [Phytophthora citrophthora]